MNDATREQWRDVPGHPSYQASNTGLIRSKEFPHSVMNRWGRLTHRIKKGKVMSMATTHQGYKRVSIMVSGKCVSHAVHRLVALAWISNDNNKPHVNHIDSNPGNNNVGNLEWCSAKENIQHSFKAGRRTSIRPGALCIAKSLAKTRKPIQVADLYTGEETSYPSVSAFGRRIRMHMSSVSYAKRKAGLLNGRYFVMDS